MVITERYQPLPLAANSTTLIRSDHIGGFLCTTSGTITVVVNNDIGTGTTTIINALAVTAGVYYPLPFYLGKTGGSITTAGGAIGTLGV